MAKSSDRYANFFWDMFCTLSVVGIWPRFVEPNLLSTTSLSLSLPKLPKDLENFKILQFSDLHFSKKSKDYFLDKIITAIKAQKPDLIVFTGDALSYCVLEDQERLKTFLKAIPKAPYGSYFSLGNHDYAESVSINANGEYDIVDSKIPFYTKILNRLCFNQRPVSITTERASKIPPHKGLVRMLRETPFTLLDNETKLIKIKNSALNICGLGEYMLAKMLPEVAFKNYDKRFPGIVLAHNPDSVSKLANYPGEVVLCGHTHGGQVNLPWVADRLTAIETPHLKRGLHKEHGKWVYVNKGVGSVMTFRWFARPEILSLTLKSSTS